MNHRHNAASHTVVGDTIRQVGHKIDDMSEKAATKSDQLIREGESTLSSYTDTALVYVKKNPLKATLIAAGVGLLIGRLLL